MDKKLPYLQIARAIAALMVVLHHITGAGIFYLNFNPLGGIFMVGWNGVDFFFVLSGFIIYYIHSKDLGRPAEWKRYMLKRLIRIYPIYWVIAAICFAVLLMGNKNISDPSLSGNIFKSSYLIKSLLLIPQNAYPFVKVAWSLCYEMFFYIIFGICILFGRRIGLIFIVVYLALLSSQVFHWIPISENSVLSFPSSNYNLEFLIGIFVAWCFKRVESGRVNVFSKQWMARLFLGAGLLIFIAAWRHSLDFQAGFSKFSFYTRIFYGIAAGLIIFGIANLKLTKVNRVTSFFLLLGDASYVLYLVHPLVLAILFKVILRTSLYGGAVINYSVSVFALLVCVTTGILLHKKVEAVILNFLNIRLVRKSYLPLRSS